jgi:hypothetical protein
MGVPLPHPSFLDEQEYLGYVHGGRRWRSADGKRLYTYDALHGEIEVFNTRGRHLGAANVLTGAYIKEPVKGRRIDV